MPNKQATTESVVSIKDRGIDVAFITISIVTILIAIFGSTSYINKNMSLTFILITVDVILSVFNIYRFFSKSNFENRQLVGKIIYLYRVIGILMGIMCNIAVTLFAFFIVAKFSIYVGYRDNDPTVPASYYAVGVFFISIPSFVLFGLSLADYIFNKKQQKIHSLNLR